MTVFDFGSLTIDAQDFAVRSAAVLGIRDSGKTYTATLLAERLFDAGIPFIAFDPIGVWRWMRVPGAGGRGYPVVVAGGVNGDIPLTIESAPEIVRAAMKAGVSVVIDLFSMELSKAAWRKIVMSCVKTLLHENQPYGPRHVFLEEAAEFVPQKVNDWDVYAEVEKLARMGGNSGVGLTIINQRAEEVSKAILELCDNLFLHRQKGKNSLVSLSKWLDVANVSQPREIIESLSTLPSGECWAWLHSSDRPVRVSVPQKNSLHPDRRTMAPNPSEVRFPVDVAGFVEAIKAALQEKARDETQSTRSTKSSAQVNRVPDAGEIAAAEARGYERGHADGSEKIMRAVASLATDLADSIAHAEESCARAKTLLSSFSGFVDTQADETAKRRSLRNCANSQAVSQKPASSDAEKLNTAVPPTRQRILDAIAWLASIGHATPDKTLVAFLAGASPKSSAFANNLGALRTAGLIDYPAGGCVALTDEGAAIATRPVQALTHAAMMAKIGQHFMPAQMRLLEALCKAHPRSLTKEALAEKVGASATSSAFANNLGRLRSLGMITYPVAGTARADDRLFPERA